jgi:hypothetical protein
MLCENCHAKDATVHLSGWASVSSTAVVSTNARQFERHFCEACAASLKQAGQRRGGGAERIKLCVISVNPDVTVLRQVRDGFQEQTEILSFVTSRLPADYTEVGQEFEVICTEAELRWLQGLGRL